jgi:iron complex transport system substrate-binding protein
VRIGRFRIGGLALLACFIAAHASAEDVPKRVITLGGDVTEIVFSLGEQQRLAGRDSTSVFPAEAAPVADVGYFRQLGAEGVLSLKPDLILATAAAGPPEALEQIGSAGVRIVRMPDGYSPDGLFEKVATISNALGIVEKGTALSDTLKRDMAAATAEVAGLPGKPKVLFIIGSGNGAPMAAGRRTAADALIGLAGGENIFAAYEGYKPISLEAAAAAGPETIAMMDHTLEAMGGVAGVVGNPALRLTPAAKAKRIVARNGSFLLSFGPRLPKAIVEFAHAIRGKGQS